MTVRNLIIPILEFGQVIEMEMGHLLHTHMPGLYTPASRGLKRSATPQHAGISLNSDSGGIVLNMSDLTVPMERTRGTVGVCLVKDFVNCLIDGMCVWVDNKVPFHTILNAYLINPDDLDSSVNVEERIRGLLQELTHEVCSFVGQDNWFIYNTSQIGFDLKIEKVEDFRIYEYTRLKREGVI